MKYSTTSQKRLDTGEYDLRVLFNEVIKTTRVDFGIADVFRTIAKQLQYFKEGKSDKDGINNLSKHNYNPSRAVDIYGWVNGRETYDERTLCYLAGHIMGTAAELLKAGKITHEIRWGGNWDDDGEIITDQRLRDLVHFELMGF
jgi:peptidoglycan L-alanyl-D-glutamate endopeptidase CwlK